MTPQPVTSDFDTDIAIIGSGFGGSVAALRLSEKGYRVTVLEKGRRWLPAETPDLELAHPEGLLVSPAWAATAPGVCACSGRYW